MTKVVRLRRGTTLNHTSGSGFTGAIAEVTVDTTNNTLRVHDGVTVGGHELVGVAVTQTITNKNITATQLNVGVGGTIVTTTGIGSVGIGSTRPTALLDVFGSIKDSIGNVRALPLNTQTSSYSLTSSDAGKLVSITTGGVTVPADIFATGDVISVYNNSSSVQSITQGASTTLRLAATGNTGSRFLSQFGVCSVICVSSNTFVISGAGVT